MATTESDLGIDSHSLQTIKSELQEVRATASQNAILVQIYPTSLNLGSRHPLGNVPQEIGRGDNCPIRVSHHSVSRKHACIRPMASGYGVRDLDSTNGTFVNNVQIADAVLHDGDYLRVGACIFRFLAGSNLEAEYHEEIHRLTIFDALTEAHNKRFLLEFLDRELARAMRHSRTFSLVFLDVDHFKRVNDQHGHLCGDHVLREIAGRIRKSLRKDELLARYGGEEFAAVLPETLQPSAVEFAERIRALVADEPFSYDGESLPVTVSLGVATTLVGQPDTTEDLLRRADVALYRAKDAGRNRVCGDVASDKAENSEQPI